MKKIIIGAAIIAALVGGLIWLGLSRHSTSDSLTFATVSQQVQDGAKLYDVRTAEEYAAGHFTGATNFPLQTMQAGNLPAVTKDTKIYVYCHSGNRSGQATVILKNAGYTNVTDLHGVTSVEGIGGTLITD